jgi:predicted nucleotidyltransferase
MKSELSLDGIRAALSPILREHGAERAIVFGSYARGAQDRRSDVDLLIIKKADAPFFDRFAEFADIYRALRGVALDLLIYTPDEVVRNADRAFVRTVLRQGVTIYER